MNQKLRTWDSPFWQEMIVYVLADEMRRLEYDYSICYYAKNGQQL
jgi:hypothetical protein